MQLVVDVLIRILIEEMTRLSMTEDTCSKLSTSRWSMLKRMPGYGNIDVRYAGN